MFSGIIENTGIIQDVESLGDSYRLFVSSEVFGDDTIELGDSIAVSGVCLTVVEIKECELAFDIASETLRCTVLGELEKGDKVNLEKSLRVGDRVHGHFVSGHVDSVGEVVEIADEDNTKKFSFSAPESILKYCAKKGSITINGVSLTLGDVLEDSFSVYIIPHTLEKTNFSDFKVGTKVNLEVDMLARYVVELGNKQDV